MTHHQQNLRQLISEGMYAVEERSLADAIIARASVRETVAGSSFRSDMTPARPRRGARGRGRLSRTGSTRRL